MTLTTSRTSTVTSTLAEYAASTSADQLPPEVRVRAQQIVLDEMGSATFGRRCTSGALAAQYALAMTGRPEATMLGTNDRLSAPYAAFANGMAGHADEIDGAHVVGGHPGATLVHAALAVAERQLASGAELVNAVALGYDVGTRLIQACGGLFGVKTAYHLHPDFLHAAGAAVACSRLLGLDPSRYHHALALVTFQANGLCSLFRERRHISKALCNGQYAFAGVSAALMAAAGMEGSDDVIGEEHGLLDAWGVQDSDQILTRGLGSEYAVMGANFKFMRAGYPIHAAVEAALSLLSGHAIAPSSIMSVQVGMPAHAMRVVDNRTMRNICLQDMLTVAVLHGGLSLRESYFPDVLEDPRFHDLRARITLRVDGELESRQPNGRDASVTITTETGTTVSCTVESPRGHALRGGTTWDELSAKWRDALPAYDVDRQIALAKRMDDLESVTELVDAFRARG
jgi:2-methylcitrate dehydratase PrpD